MAFEVFVSEKPKRSPRSHPRRDECLSMFSQLDSNATLTAKIDMSDVNVRQYAKKLGYKVRTRKVDKSNTLVWIEKGEK